MEQTIQKPSLPIKTKIAAWWMIVVGGISSLLSFFMAVGYVATPGHAIPGHVFIEFFMYLLSFVAGLFLFARKKWAWWFSIYLIIIFYVAIMFFSFFPFSYSFAYNEIVVYYKYFDLARFISIILSRSVAIILSFIPFILLLLDRKNYWKIAT